MSVFFCTNKNKNVSNRHTDAHTHTHTHLPDVDVSIALDQQQQNGGLQTATHLGILVGLEGSDDLGPRHLGHHVANQLEAGRCTVLLQLQTTDHFCLQGYSYSCEPGFCLQGYSYSCEPGFCLQGYSYSCEPGFCLQGYSYTCEPQMSVYSLTPTLQL